MSKKRSPAEESTLLTDNVLDRLGPRLFGETTDSTGRPMPPEVAELRGDPDRHWGKYILVEEVGEGGFSVVHKAWQEDLARWVALKVLRQGFSASHDRVLREAQSAACLDDPRIPQVFEVGEWASQVFIAMQYIDGLPLHRHDLSPRKAAEVLKETAIAIGHAHDRGVIHRDLKPENILRTGDGRLYITDFGLARLLDANQTLIPEGTIAGTPHFMAPEQAVGNSAEICPGTDVWALGATLYYLLAREHPFGGENLHSIIHRIVRQEPTELRKQVPDIHRDLAAIVHRCLEKAPRHRYANGTELAEDLDRYLEGREVLARPNGILRRAARTARRHPVRVALGLLIAIAFVGLWAFSAIREALIEEERRSGALAHLTEGRDALAERESLRDRLPETDQERWAPERLQLLDEIERLSLDAETELQNAYRLDPQAIPIQQALAHFYLDRAEGAEREYDQMAANRDLERARFYAREEFPSVGRLTLKTDPPGATVLARSLKPGSDEKRDLPPTPFASLPLEAGFWLLEIRSAGRPLVRHAIIVRRGEDHRFEIEIPTEVDLEDGEFTYVPAGPIITEEDPLSLQRSWKNEEVEEFFIARHELTCGRYRQFLQAMLTEGKSDQWFDNAIGRSQANSQRANRYLLFRKKGNRVILLRNTENHAVGGLDWDSANEYCKWRTNSDPKWEYRLPRTYEWEKAARGCDGRLFPWGDQEDPSRCRWAGNPSQQTSMDITKPFPVGEVEGDRSIYGVFDMAGNLEEWCNDEWMMMVTMQGRRGSLDPKLIRGGSFLTSSFWEISIPKRQGSPRENRSVSRGFRLVKVRSR